MYQEDLTGPIEVGKRADLVVIDRNIFKIATADIAKTKVLMTLVHGKQVFIRAPRAEDHGTRGRRVAPRPPPRPGTGVGSIAEREVHHEAPSAPHRGGRS